MIATPWEQGERAFVDDRGLDTNPYDEGSPAWMDWRNGYLAAQRKSEEGATHEGA